MPTFSLQLQLWTVSDTSQITSLHHISTMRHFSPLVGACVLLVLLVQLSGAAEAATCSCNCCSGNSCTPSNVGTTTVSSCSDSCSIACRTIFPTSCPASGSSGVVSASCSSGGGGGGYDPSMWYGSYTASGCSQQACCCLGPEVTIASTSSSQATISGPLVGNCGSAAGTIATITTPVPTSNTFDYTYGGQSHTATLYGKSITDINNSNNQCSATLVKNNAVAAYSLPTMLLVVLTALASLLQQSL